MILSIYLYFHLEALNSLSICEFLKNYYKNQQECFHHFEILKQQIINGKAFMLLTEQKLKEATTGTILLIKDLIKKLKSSEEGKEIVNI